MTDQVTAQDVPTRRLRIRGIDVTLPLGEAWREVKRPGGVTLQLGAPDGIPAPTLALELFEADGRTVLTEQVTQVSAGLTDLTLLHLGLRESPAGNWKDTEPDARTVLATYRQGIWTLALQFGVLAADGDERCLLLTGICPFEELATIDPVLADIVARAEVAW